MRILWASEDDLHIDFGPSLGEYEMVHQNLELSVASEEPDALIVAANGGRGNRSRRTGLIWLQWFRRKTRCAAPAVVYSFEDHSSLADAFTMLNDGEPGVCFVRLPVHLDDLMSPLALLSSLDEEQMSRLLMMHSGLQEETARLSHTLGNVLSGWEDSKYQAEDILDEWEELICACAPQLLIPMKQLRNLLELMPRTVDSVRRQIELLQRSIRNLRGSPSDIEEQDEVMEPPDAPQQLPPIGLDRVLVGDDTGWVASTVSRLQDMGYQVRVVDNLKSVRALLQNQEFPILLADLNFPERKDGRALQSLGQERGMLVMAISKDLADSADLLPGVVDNCGGSRFQDAERIHRLIWQYASAHGIAEAMPGTPRTETGSLCKSIHNLAFTIKDRIERWRAMAEAIDWLICRAEYIRSKSLDIDERLLADRLIALLRPLSSYAEIPLLELRSLESELADMSEEAKRISSRDDEGSLYNALHNSVGQHIALAAAGLHGLDSIDGFVVSLGNMSPDFSLQASMIQSALNECRSRLTIHTMDHLRETLEAAEEMLVPLTANIPKVSLTPNVMRAKRFRIVSVEDQPRWQEFVREAIMRAKNSIGAGCTIEDEYYDNVEDAISALRSPAPIPNSSLIEDRPMTIVITDMGLPATREDAALIRKCLKSAARRNGRDLLVELRSYNINLPTIILSAPSDSLQDQMDLCELGIADTDFIFKNNKTDSIDELVQAILRIISRARVHEIAPGTADRCEARIDGIPISLDERMPFRTFSAICELSSLFPQAGRFFTAEDIIGKLDAIYGGYLPADAEAVQETMSLEREDWWGDCTPIQFENVVRLWNASKAKATDSAKAIGLFNDSNFMVWKMAMSLLDRFLRFCPERVLQPAVSDIAVSRLGPEELAALMDCAFGDKETTSLGYDPANIADHVYRIRLAVHLAFAEQGQFIDPQIEVLVRGLTPAKEYGYRVIGNIVFPKPDPDDSESLDSQPQPASQPNTIERKLRVLIVENEPLYSEGIKSLLDSMGFDVVGVTNRDDAIREGLGDNRPDILSLDLHIPGTPDEYALDYRNGSVDNGLQVLGCLRGAIPSIKVLAPTTLFDSDSTREQAARMGLPVSNIVPKGVEVDGAPWESLLLLTASRLRNEILLGARLPYVSPTRCPFVRISPDTNLSHADISKRKLVMTVNESVFSKKSGNQGMLLALLLSNPRETILKEDLQIAIYGRLANHNEWEGIKKNVRKEIREIWLGVQADSPERSAFDILKDVGEGLIIHAIVDDPAKRLGRKST